MLPLYIAQSFIYKIYLLVNEPFLAAFIMVLFAEEMN